MRPEDRIVIAAIARPHGVRGAVRLKVFNPDTEMLAKGARVTVTPTGGAPRTLKVARAAEPTGDVWILWFDGVTTFEAAEELRGAEISVARSELPPEGDGEYYHADLVGCEARDTAGTVLGVVREVTRYPSVDALVVPTAKGEIEIPLVAAIVTAVDLVARTITVDTETLDLG